VTERDLSADTALDAQLRQEGERLRAARAGCPPPDLLFARQSESLDAGLRERMETHVAGCAACRRMAADVAQLELGTPDADVESRVASRVLPAGGHGRGGMLSIAAALLLASGLAVTWWYQRTPPKPPAAATSTPQPAMPIGPAEPPPVLALWTIVAPPVRLPLSALGATRSGTGSAAAAPGLADALTPYQSGDYAGAADAIAKIVEAQPQSGEAQFYLGVSLLLGGRAEAAQSPLERAVALLPADRRNEAEWYLATAEQRAGNNDAARARLRRLCAAAGTYKAGACAAEATLK
jgi:tetratricopeptide (TPR) repeat protein